MHKKKRRKKKTKKATGKYILLVAFFACIGIGMLWLMKTIEATKEKSDSDQYMVKGIDVSHHNPIINWDMVLEQGFSFAYMKATGGISIEDRNYPYNYERARKSNVRVGSYHFYLFGESGKEQAQHFIRVAKCQQGDLYPAIDVEHSPTNPYSTDAAYVALVIKELKILENELYQYYGVHPIVYTNRDCYKLYIQNNFANNHIWISSLDKAPDEKINWKIWQYTHTGKLPGVEGDIDFNYYRHSFDEFKEIILP